MVKQQTKKWYVSKTILINALVIAVGVGTAVLSEVQAGVTLTAVGLLNIVLRVVTKAQLK